MSINAQTHTFGPENAELLVHTHRTGAAARAGHDLVIEVTSWNGTLQLGENRAVTLTADGNSLRVREGRGGIQALGDDDKASITQSIDDEVLKRTAIEFRSTAVEGDTQLRVQGELEILGKARPITFEVTITDDGRLAGSAIVKQSDWGIKPFSILFGTLKVADEVEVAVDGELGS